MLTQSAVSMITQLLSMSVAQPGSHVESTHLNECRRSVFLGHNVWRSRRGLLHVWKKHGQAGANASWNWALCFSLLHHGDRAVFSRGRSVDIGACLFREGVSPMKNWHILIASVVFLSLTACQSGKSLAVPDPDDLLFQARTWRTEHGMAKARDDLTEALGKLDSGKGEFERRLWRTNADKSLTFPDSLSGLSLAERHRTGIFWSLATKPRRALRSE